MSVPATPRRSSRLTMSQGAQFLGGALAVVGATLLMGDPAAAQALQPVVRVTTIIRDTVVIVALAVMTIAIGTAGYRVAFAGATYRDIMNLVLGGVLCGGAAALAANFIA